jgi:hypothetical protein
MSLPTPSTPLDQRDPTFRRPKLAHYSTPLDTFEPELAQVHRHDKPRRRDHAPSLRAPGRLTPNLNQLETLVDARLYEADPGGLSRLDRCFEVVFYYQPQSPKGGDSTRSESREPLARPILATLGDASPTTATTYAVLQRLSMGGTWQCANHVRAEPLRLA